MSRIPRCDDCGQFLSLNDPRNEYHCFESLGLAPFWMCWRCSERIDAEFYEAIDKLTVVGFRFNLEDAGNRKLFEKQTVVS